MMKHRFACLAVLTLLAGSIMSLGSVGGAGSSLVPGTSPTPSPTPPARPRVAAASPSPTPTSTPVPSPTASPRPTARPVTASLEDLQARIRAKLAAPEIQRGRVGIKIASLASGKVIFENDADKYFTPASNMKNFTVSAALEKLGPEFKFVTQVLGPRPDANGTVPGDLRIIGGGDITMSTAFFGTTPDDPETYYKGVDRLVDKISAAGIKKIDGDLVGDESYFRGFYIPPSWEWDDLQWKDGTGVSALPINDNDVDLSVTPGAPGQPCVVTVKPANTIIKVENVCTTTSVGTKRQLTVNRRLDQNYLWVGGSMPADDRPFTGVLALAHPADLFMALLRERLEKRGITVTGRTTTTGNVDYHPTTPPAPVIASTRKADILPVELTRLESLPFSVVAARTMKPSQNMYTETILWALGESTVDRYAEPPGQLKGAPLPERPASDSLGLAAAKKFRDSIGIPADAVVQQDGSGMSRHDKVTPSAVVQLYTYMAKQSKYAQVWRDSLAVGGIDGTLRNRFRGTAADNNLRGKTGTLDQVSALSGYIKTKSGEELVFSIIVNNVPGESRIRTNWMDEIVLELAGFAGKIDQ